MNRREMFRRIAGVAATAGLIDTPTDAAGLSVLPSHDVVGERPALAVIEAHVPIDNETVARMIHLWRESVKGTALESSCCPPTVACSTNG